MGLLHDWLERAAASHPESVAVVDGDREMSYRDLNEWSGRIANLLVRLGVQRGDRVALLLDKSLESVAGIYGAMKAGAAYVPLDPGAPGTRLATIARSCDARVLLSTTAKQVSWPSLVEAAPSLIAVVTLDAAPPSTTLPRDTLIVGSDAIAAEGCERPAVDTIDLDLAYILYTSGSTGDPKGVKLTHLNATAFAGWAAEEFALTPDDRVSSHAPFHFDLSVFDLFSTVAAGGTVVLCPKAALRFPVELLHFLQEQRITVSYCVPSALSMLALRGGLKPGDLPDLRAVLFAGEVFPTKYLRTLMNLVDARFANLYGLTETNVCTWYEVPDLPADSDSPIPIGRAIPGVECVVVGDEGSLVAPGGVGELWVRGSTVMQGYWGDLERTSAVLVPNPFNSELADRVYRTGDLVRQQPDGNFEFLGRRDAQIKSRGYRIELGDVEAAINAHPSVIECAAVPVPDELVTNRIKAYVTARDGLTGRILARFCAERIPQYMVPELWELVDGLPRTSTGKIDRARLTAQASEAEEAQT